MAEPALTPTNRAPLRRDRVLHAAVSYADAHGVDALSMRKLAQFLGFEVMSLYNHVASKDDLLEGMLEVVAEEMEPAPEDGRWTAAIRTSVISAHRMMRRHPWVGALWARPVGQTRLRWLEALLAALDRGGLPADVAHRGFHAVNNHLLGFALQEELLPIDEADVRAGAAAFLDSLPAGEYPRMRAHVQQHLSGAAEDEFSFGLDLILDGLQRLARDG